MKELKEGELIDLAYNEIKKMDIHSWSQIVISLLVIVQAIFLIFDIITLITYCFIWIVFLILYFFHRNKIKKSEIKMQEILDELTSRNI
jgi:hypothetical protein